MSRSKLLYNHRHLKKLNSRLFLRKSKATKTTKVSEIIELFLKLLPLLSIVGALTWTINLFFAQHIQEKYLNYFNIHPGPSELIYNKFTQPLHHWMLIILLSSIGISAQYFFIQCVLIGLESSTQKLPPKTLKISIVINSIVLAILLILICYTSYFSTHPWVCLFLLSLPAGFVAYYTYPKISSSPEVRKKINKPYPARSTYWQRSQQRTRQLLVPVIKRARSLKLFLFLWFCFWFPNLVNSFYIQAYAIGPDWAIPEPSYSALGNYLIISLILLSSMAVNWVVVNLVSALVGSDTFAFLGNILLLLTAIMLPSFYILDYVHDAPVASLIPCTFEYIAFSYPYPKPLGKQGSNSEKAYQYNLRLELKDPHPSYDNLVGQKPVIIPFYDNQAYYVFPCNYKGDITKCFPEGKAKIPIIIPRSEVIRIKPYWEATSVVSPSHSINHK